MATSSIVAPPGFHGGDQIISKTVFRLRHPDEANDRTKTFVLSMI